MLILLHAWCVLRAVFVDRYRLVMENAALRQQLAHLIHKLGKPHMTRAGRLFWMAVSNVWDGWRDSVMLVRPETVVRWKNRGFRKYWTWKCRGGPGRPRVPVELRELIRRMSRDNPIWGAPRIHGELTRLGIEVSEATVSRYMVRNPRKPSLRWRTFLENHVGEMVSVDFFTVPTVMCKILFAFVVLSHDRRRILHVNVTDSPTSEWAALQLTQAFPYDEAPRYMLRDRDKSFCGKFDRTAKEMRIHQVRIAPRSPWQNAYVERVIGTIRRECLDHVVVLNEAHLRRLLNKYVAYYNESRTHLSLGKDAPDRRAVETVGDIVSEPVLGGMHHRYSRKAA